jgi:hypothetical protein
VPEWDLIGDVMNPAIFRSGEKPSLQRRVVDWMHPHRDIVTER